MTHNKLFIFILLTLLNLPCISFLGRRADMTIVHPGSSGSITVRHGGIPAIPATILMSGGQTRFVILPGLIWMINPARD